MITVWMPLLISGCGWLGLDDGWPFNRDRDEPTGDTAPPPLPGPTFDRIGRCGTPRGTFADDVGRTIGLGEDFQPDEPDDRRSGFEIFERSDDFSDFVVSQGGTYRAGAVDFSREVVVFAWAYTRGTCGLELDDWTAFQNDDGTVAVQFDFTDQSRDCDVVCDAIGHVWTAVAVPFEGDDPAVCHQTGGGC